MLIVLLIASFVYSLNLVSNTALEYHRRPRVSASISVLGAIMSVALGLLLIPPFGLIGGAIATLGAYLTVSLFSHVMAWRITRQSYFGEIAIVGAALVALALLAAWPGWMQMHLLLAAALKLAIVGIVFTGLAAIYVPRRFRQVIARIRGKL